MGPLDGVRVLEIAGVGPAPFGAMMLADMGAEVLRVDRLPLEVVTGSSDPTDLLNRGKLSVAADLKQPEAVELLLTLAEQADVLVEGFRPGVAERLGIGPEVVTERNPRLVYARMTGWGQEGPYAHLAGHDLNYLGLAGVLAHIGRKDSPPVPPLNLVGDFGGGGMLVAFGIVCALLERSVSGRGQVIDAAMLDGAALLATNLYSMRAAGMWTKERESNLVDGGAPFYDTFETSDGKYVAIGAMEPKFFERLVERLGLPELPDRWDRANWPEIRSLIADRIRTETRDRWTEIFDQEDACVGPVLDYDEARWHPHNVARATFVHVDDVLQPAPAPRFSRTPGSLGVAPPTPGRDTDEALSAWGISEEEIRRYRKAAAIG